MIDVYTNDFFLSKFIHLDYRIYRVELYRIECLQVKEGVNVNIEHNYLSIHTYTEQTRLQIPFLSTTK